jgi:TPR repeat protein
MAADKGEAEAQNNIGSLYYNGQGVSRDLELARQWWRKAAAGGSETAKRNLAQHGG